MLKDIYQGYIFLLLQGFALDTFRLEIAQGRYRNIRYVNDLMQVR